MGRPAIRTGLTPAEYLAFERASAEKHEYADGEIFAMAGCSREHSLITGNVYGELRSALLDRPCELHTSDMRVQIAARGRYLYPDASVVCGEPIFEDSEIDTLVNPKLIVEVLSDSTEAYDRGDKFEQYRSLPSFTDYLLISQKAKRVEHFQRQPDGNGRWLLTIAGRGAAITIASIGVTLEIERLYLKVPLPAPADEQP
jgi:Uma2 family endonuclease